MSLSGLASVLLLFTPAQTASAADDYLNTVVSGLESSSVYVEPGTPGTNADTSAELKTKLDDGDQITIVLLSSDAAQSITDPGEFAAQLSDSLGNDDIIGVAIGDQVVGYSNILPSGVASDLMQRADSVSTTNTETLGTYVRNVHSYVTQHPFPVDAQPANDSHTSVWIGGGLVVALALAAVGASAIRRRRIALQPKTTTSGLSPKLQQHIDRISYLTSGVRSLELSQTLRSCCQDLEAYFVRYSDDKQGDATIFDGHLSSVIEVLERYLDIQNNPRYFKEPQEDMQMGQRAIEGFADFVLQSCKNETETDLARYSVNTQILEAQRS